MSQVHREQGNNSWQWKGCCNFQLRWGVTCSTPSCMLAVTVLYCEHNSDPVWPLTTIGLASSKWNEILYCDTKVWLWCYAIAYPPMEIKFFKPSPLFLLYNSEMWTLTYTKEKLIDAFHIGLLRISINVRYPKIIMIKSTKLYTLAQQTPLNAGGEARL